MYDIVTVGEGMLRLSPPPYQRLRRTRTLDLEVCGSQGNVACNAARLGLKAAFVTRVPDNALGLLLQDHYAGCGVDTAHIQTVQDSRVGVNYLEFGSTPRASAVVYDRAHSAASTIELESFDWDAILKGTRLAYTDGIFPGLSASCREAAFEFVAAARRQECLVAFDVNYREHLWAPQEARDVLSKIIESVDVLVSSRWHAETVFGYAGSDEEMMQRFHETFGCRVVAMTLREDHDVRHGTWDAAVLYENQVLRGRRYEVDLIDRFGGGDAWSAGFFFGYLTNGDVEYGLNFGNALCALNHTFPGDVAHVSPREVEALMASEGMHVRR